MNYINNCRQGCKHIRCKWSKTHARNIEEYERIIKYNKRIFNFKSQYDYELCKYNNKSYLDNPKEYFHIMWKNWAYFIGLNTKKFAQTITEWKKICKDLNIKSVGEYDQATLINELLPPKPSEFYKDFTSIVNELDLIPRRRR